MEFFFWGGYNPYKWSKIKGKLTWGVMTSPRNFHGVTSPTLPTTGFWEAVRWVVTGASTYRLSSFGGLRFCRGWRDFLHGCLGCFFFVVGGWSLVVGGGVEVFLRREGGWWWLGSFVYCWMLLLILYASSFNFSGVVFLSWESGLLWWLSSWFHWNSRGGERTSCCL